VVVVAVLAELVQHQALQKLARAELVLKFLGFQPRLEQR
jgi:hypothetical protein